MTNAMLTQQVIFYGFALIAVLSALMVVALNNPVRCALFLVLTFLSSAVLWLFAYAEFLALVLILVYVGAVMTLFLFVIMMLDINIVSERRHFVKYVPLGLIVISLLVTAMLVALRSENFDFAPLTEAIAHPQTYSNVSELGLVLYTQYAFAFEIAAVLLLVAIIAAISLAHRGPQQSKSQRNVQQMLTERKDRVRLVAMKAESGEGSVQAESQQKGEQ